MELAPVEGIGPPPRVLETLALPLRHTGTNLADRSGIEPDSHGLTVRPHTVVRFGQHMVLDVGFELTTFALQEHCSTY